MSALAKVPAAEAPRSLLSVRILTLGIIILGAVAAAAGLFLPDLYHGTAWIVSATRGTDLYTLAVAVPAMAVTFCFLRPGAVRATLVMMGLVAYMLYTYVGAALTYDFTGFFPIYVALFSLSVFALAALVGSLDVAGMDRRFGATAPRKPIAIFLIVMGVMLLFMEVGQLMPYYATGAMPLPMQLAESTDFYPFALDLGLIAPLTLLSGIWLWQRRPAGYLLTSCMLIKSATMGFALIATNAYNLMMGQTTDTIAWILMYSMIGLGGLGFAIWFFRHCRAIH